MYAISSGCRRRFYRVQHSSRDGHAEIRLHMFGLIPQQRRHAVSLGKAEAGERPRQSLRAAANLFPFGSHQPAVRTASDDLHVAEYPAGAFNERRNSERKIHHQSTHRPRFSIPSPMRDAASYHHISRIPRATKSWFINSSRIYLLSSYHVIFLLTDVRN